MKNRNNILFRLVGVILCIVMLLSVVACTQSPDTTVGDATDKITETETETETEAVETMKVVVFKMKAVKGNLLNKYRLELADVPLTELPIDPITNIEDAIDKYLLEDADKGVCVSASMLSTMDPLVSAHGLGNDYVLITDVINANTDIKDMSELIQKAIDENPGKTIYFPDGKYELTKTVVIPSDPEKSVSFRMSNYATFVPSNDWASAENTALIQYGTPDSPKTQSGDDADYFMGGILDVNRKCTAIEVYGGGRLFINNVSIKDARIGIHLKPNAAYNDIENVNVTCQYITNVSKGIFVEGTNNTFVNMRIYHPFYGAHITGGDNVLVNIHPLGNPTNNIASTGFYDQSTGNRYSICYSDQYPVGFKMESQTVSYFDMCYMYWWQACDYQIGFLCIGEFNSIISDTAVSMSMVNSSTQNHYLYFIEETKTEETEQIPTQPEQQPEEDEKEEQGGQQGGRPNREEAEEPTQDVNEAPAKGSGVIINPSVAGERNADSDTYKQFVYNPKN